MISIFHIINSDSFYRELKGDTFKITQILICSEKRNYQRNESSIYVNFKIETDQNDSFEMGVELNTTNKSYDDKITEFCIFSKNEKIRLNSDNQVLKWLQSKMEEKIIYLRKQLVIKNKIDEINNEFAE